MDPVGRENSGGGHRRGRGRGGPQNGQRGRGRSNQRGTRENYNAQRGGGIGGDERYRQYVPRNQDLDERGPPAQRARRVYEEYERIGPVFGFQRLNRFLSTNANEVILSIDHDLTHWQAFLISDELDIKSDKLALVMSILGEKICSDDVTLGIQQIKVLVETNADKFIAKLTEKCGNIFLGIDTQQNAGRRNYNIELIQVDNSSATFLTNVYKYSAFMAKKMPEISVDYIQRIVASAYSAVINLCSATSDEKMNSLRENFEELRKEIISLVRKREEKPKSHPFRFDQLTIEEEKELHDMDAPSDFREMAIIPSARELLSKEEVFLRPNKIEGAYKNSQHYLDVQYRLLREDFVQPLKIGIQNFMKNRFDYLSRKKKMPLGTIRIYPDVQIITAELVRDAFIYKVQLAEESYKRIKWDKSKRLLTGSLLVFTSDFFENAYFAIVANRNVDELSKGILSMTWEGLQPIWDRDDEYLMVECEVYFESYRYTLQTLKQLELETFPMSKFIVGASSDVEPPTYLTNMTELVQIELSDNEIIHFSPLIDEQWPNSNQLGLDINQFTAFKAALTKQFAIIQGPPGTGKTYLGLRIAEVFLNNEHLWKRQGSTDGPILVVCYTNHALDQFLEGVLKIFEKKEKTDGEKNNPSIIRVGGRSKSEVLQKFSLGNVIRRRNHTHKMPKHYWQHKNTVMSDIDDLRNQRESIMAALMGLRDIQGIVNFEQLEVANTLRIEYPSILWKCLTNIQWFGFEERLYHSNDSVDTILSKWFEIRQVSGGKVKKMAPKVPKKKPQEKQPEKEDSEDDEDYDVEELESQRGVFDDIYIEAETRAPANMGKHLRYISGFSLRESEKAIQDANFKITKLLTEKPSQQRTEQISRLEFAKRIGEKKRKLLERIFELYKQDMIELPNVKPLIEQLKAEPGGIIPPPNLQRLDISQRWALFFEVVENARGLSAEKAQEIEGKLKNEQKKLHEIQRMGEGHILRSTLIVGMTTTGAAKYNDLVRMMESKIVIVEEAAEVLESHIVTCITKHCEHLILIGDHRQLRPNTTVYDLAKKYNLDISLFERMIKNNLNCYQLKVQHRMRPEIANLVVGTIYEELHNHPSVLMYPSVIGVTKNLYFLSHNELEKADSDSMSKSNLFEAKYLASFCRYLILQGYSPDQITVLTTYTGQMFLLKKTFGVIPNCKGVKITCVDNFQGEENDIILLSLVRSNMESKIGFLNIDNRICVAISRAKVGLYIVGNMSMLSTKSPTWSKIQDKLILRGEIGPTLLLECQIHGTLSNIQNDTEFTRKVPEGGCQLLCSAQLQCTHNCQKVCHIIDQEHKDYRCQLPCLLRCSNDHPCRDKCFKKCPPCNVSMQKTLPCLHIKEIPCWRDASDVQCFEIVKKRLPCGHEEDMPCFKDPSEITCRVELEKELPCNHKKIVECHIDSSLITCKVIVKKTLIPCLHETLGECRFAPEMISCKTMVVKKFDNCGHQRDVQCCDKNKFILCKMNCSIRLPCGHACTKVCHVEEDPNHLTYKCMKDCAKICTSGHKCGSKHKCHSQCPPCKVKVERKLEKCSHVAEMDCAVDPLDHQCIQKCEHKLNCYHFCQNLCYQEHGPCFIEVKKRIRECGHPITIPCKEHPSQNLCEQLVMPARNSECGHITQVPCKIRLIASTNEIMQFCNQPCNDHFSEETGGCGHKCLGTCNTCLQGRFHQKCQGKCGKSLVCGHVCEFPCSKACPPCGKTCIMKCEHSECSKNCGTPCQTCCEKCPWQCEHKKCTQLCREKCNREPCDEICKETLKCGHPCIGFCGEPCPTQCRVCDKKELTEEFYLYGTEGEEDSRFVFLPDCKHAIEVKGLTYHMNLAGTEIGIKRCPRCSTAIRNCRRYNNIIKERLMDVIQVKEKFFGNQKNVKESQDTLIPKLRLDKDKRWTRTLPTLHDYLLNLIADKVPVKRGSVEERFVPKLIDQYTMESLNLITEYAEEAIEVLLKNKAELKPELYTDLNRRYRELFQIVMKRQLPLGKLEIENLHKEMDRIYDLEQVYMRRSSRQFGDGHARAQPIYDMLLSLVLSYKPYTGESKTQLRNLLKQLEEILRTGLGISEKERREIIAALGMQQGHWFKCPNGHIYVITECGGAMQESVCPDCGARIGGGNHALVSGNQLAGEMDHAIAPAYPTMLQNN